MERMTRRAIMLAVLAVAGLAVVTAQATPMVDSAIIKTRIFNDDPDSVVTTTNNYPALISIKDDERIGTGLNRHNFRLSADGGVSDAVFMNADEFALYADVTLSGPNNSEGGLNLAPWWSKDVDGVFMVNAATGEIACFGGRLPFYSFTAAQGLTYTKGETVRQGIVYTPNSLSMADPATIEYILVQGGTTYTSGPLAFNEGNPAEDPPYGLWGCLNDARLGGYFQVAGAAAGATAYGEIAFENIVYVPEPAALALLGLGGLAVLRRRR